MDRQTKRDWCPRGLPSLRAIAIEVNQPVSPRRANQETHPARFHADRTDDRLAIIGILAAVALPAYSDWHGQGPCVGSHPGSQPGRTTVAEVYQTGASGVVPFADGQLWQASATADQSPRDHHEREWPITVTLATNVLT
jgi:hypothetical protein